jgi:hypothetical protein
MRDQSFVSIIALSRISDEGVVFVASGDIHVLLLLLIYMSPSHKRERLSWNAIKSSRMECRGYCRLFGNGLMQFDLKKAMEMNQLFSAFHLRFFGANIFADA